MKHKLTTLEIAVSGVLLALIIAALYMASLFETIQLTLWSLAGAVLYFASINLSRTVAALLYAGSSILGLAIVPDKISLLVYILFFGAFALIKPAAENLAAKFVSGASNDPVIRPFGRRGLYVVKRRRLVIAAAYGIKILCAAALLAVTFALMSAVFIGELLSSDGVVTQSNYVVVGAAGFIALPVLMFFIYDYLLWLVAEVFGRVFKKHFRR
ncbi:MAG: hypothetical protein LBL36_04065 [Clostridiales Family XIII bacterium]|jgi:hypothetical protein|nr:hypothetical protein [Clostridiales Family XIII bacterium]